MANAVRDEIRDAAAEAYLEVCQELGETCTYSNRSAAAVSLHFLPGAEEKTMTGKLGGQTEITRRDFGVPRQANFPPTNGIAINDTLTFGALVWYVRDFEADSLGAVHTLHCEREQARII